LIQTFETHLERWIMSQNDEHDPTKERLLDQAEALFAQKGYDAVSVREITTAARCNLAAVNYHFGSKENLYVEVFRARWAPRAMRVQESFRDSLAAQDEASPTTVARALAEAFLIGPLSDEERYRHHQLIVRELGQPTEAFKLVADEVMRPFFRQLADMLRPTLPKGLDKEGLMLNILSMFAIVLHFNFARAAVTRMTGREYDEAFKARLVEHITEFSLNGLGGHQQEVPR
jgi:AcrR family transcriptional regulator